MPQVPPGGHRSPSPGPPACWPGRSASAAPSSRSSTCGDSGERGQGQRHPHAAPPLTPPTSTPACTAPSSSLQAQPLPLHPRPRQPRGGAAAPCPPLVSEPMHTEQRERGAAPRGDLLLSSAGMGQDRDKTTAGLIPPQRAGRQQPERGPHRGRPPPQPGTPRLTPPPQSRRRPGVLCPDAGEAGRSHHDSQIRYPRGPPRHHPPAPSRGWGQGDRDPLAPNPGAQKGRKRPALLGQPRRG